MRIAIIQNQIGIDGRSAVISEVIRLCNRRKITPSIFTFSSADIAEIFKRRFGLDLNFKLDTFKGIFFKRGTAYQTPLLNMVAALKIKNFDLVFNSGRCPYFLPDGPSYVHYVHFPIEASLYNEEHFQNLRGLIYTFPLKLLYMGRSKRVMKGLFLANSHFTADAISKIYTSLDRNKIQVVYPPCDIRNGNKSDVRDIDFISLGSFISDKRQIEQIEIAKYFHQYTFNLIGGIKSKRYFERCQKIIKQSELTNIELHPNAPKEKVQNLLSRSKIYLHTKRNEHFGISTVEAIGHGCIPLVHDSGGSREIVPIQDLRFQNIEEAVYKSERIIENYMDYRKILLPVLMQNIQQYSVEIFHKKMEKILFSL